MQRPVNKVEAIGTARATAAPQSRDSSPWLGIANKQLELMQKFMAELGLSPASRSRASAYPSLAPKPWEFGTSKFAGLIGPQERDEFFDQ